MAAAQESFISSTYWTEGVGPVAALATLQQFCSIDVPEHIRQIGALLQEGLQEFSKKHNVPIVVTGPPALTSISFGAPHAAALMTLFTTRMISYSILCGSGFYPSAAHTSAHVDRYLAAVDNVLPEIKQSIALGDADARVDGKIKHTGFQRLA